MWKTLYVITSTMSILYSQNCFSLRKPPLPDRTYLLICKCPHPHTQLKVCEYTAPAQAMEYTGVKVCLENNSNTCNSTTCFSSVLVMAGSLFVHQILERFLKKNLKHKALLAFLLCKVLHIPLQAMKYRVFYSIKTFHILTYAGF